MNDKESLKETIVRAIRSNTPNDQPRRGPKSKVGSIYHISKRTGVSASSLSKFIAGQATLSTESLQKLCDYFNLRLVGETEVAKKKKLHATTR